MLGLRLLVAAAAAALLAAPCAGLLAKVTPTQKVITMLSEMKAKGEKMMDEEKTLFDKYAEWVDDKTKELGFEIKDGEAKIEELVAAISKADSDVAELSREIKALDKEIQKLTQEKADATEIRESEHAEYVKVSADYAESVDALKRAIVEVSAQDVDRAQAAVLLQRMASHVRGVPQILAAFLEDRAGRTSGDGAPEVAAYEFQSGGIVAMLEGLLKKFKAELAEVEEAESNQAHEFALVKTHLSDTIEKDTSDMKEKVVTKSKRAQASAKGRGELEKTKADKAADEKLKDETAATFEVKSAAFEQNKKVRVAEIEAIAKALEIMSSPEVAGSYSKHVNFLQLISSRHSPGAMSFLQMGSRRHRAAAGDRVAAFLRTRAKSLKSETLASFASKVSENPFAKVIDMVEGLIAKLKEEAEAEADHKAWCDEQLKENKLKRNKKTAQAEKLAASIEGLTADIAEMGDSISKLHEEQEALTKAMREATELRSKEKAENEEAIADAAAGVEAVKKALVVLTEFYSSQASFIQQEQAPEMAAYKGMQSGKGGVIGMLEVIQSDFSRLKHETETDEKAAAAEYDTLMETSRASKERKHDAEVQLKLDKDQAEFEKTEDEKDLKAVQAELAKAETYFEELKPSCLQVHVSYEERTARRKEEIQALKEAYGILDQKSSN